MTLEVPIKIFTDIEKKWEMRRKKPTQNSMQVRSQRL